jgi:diadenosine tetraphosphate (Ap4A) HIT family hydrolase
MTSSHSDCCFCAELAGEHTTFHDLYPSLSSRLVDETAEFVVIPSLGQLSPGHILLVPKQHVTSFAGLDPRGRQAAQAAYAGLRTSMSRSTPRFVAFEHGSPPGAVSGGCGIVHAHIHLVPLGEQDDAAAPVGPHRWLRSTAATWLAEAAELSRRDSGYLMWHGPDDAVRLAAASAVPSQYLRRHAASLLGAPGWDWRFIGPQRELVDLVSRARA